jgi:2-C-methyl-D-erythritol 4-phosphate cytidylyltransferase
VFAAPDSWLLEWRSTELFHGFIPHMPEIFALIPAAGSGSRMGSGVPKQYQPVAGKPLIAHAIGALCAHPRVALTFVVLAPGDAYFNRHDWSAHRGRLETLFCGGATRAASVFNGLVAMADVAEPDDWVMVHDAARPCVNAMLISRLCDELADDKVGGLLAVPVSDTLKRGDDQQRVTGTVARDHVWQAQTPQMFRYGMLLQALRAAIPGGVTDEASAIEHAGFAPRLVKGSRNNLKVTFPEDLAIAENIIKTNT